MVYKDKKRDMMRSILPATNRRGAKENLNRIRRHGRREENQDLGLYRGYADDVVDAWEEAPPDKLYPTHQIRSEVFDRRDHDKVGPICHWAVQVSRRKGFETLEDAMTWLRATLPDTYMGDHALTHIRWALTHEIFEDPQYSWWRMPRTTPAERAARKAARNKQQHDSLYLIIESGWTSQFNDQFKAAHSWEENIRGTYSYTLSRGGRYKTRIVRCDGLKHPRLGGTGQIDEFIDEYWKVKGKCHLPDLDDLVEKIMYRIAMEAPLK